MYILLRSNSLRSNQGKLYTSYILHTNLDTYTLSNMGNAYRTAAQDVFIIVIIIFYTVIFLTKFPFLILLSLTSSSLGTEHEVSC